MQFKPIFLALLLLGPLSLLAQTEIKDTDGNTRVQTEKNANEDIIRFDVGGAERMVLRRNPSANTLLEFPNSSNSLFLGGGGSGATGSGNTAFGQAALRDNLTGNNNVAVGSSALINATGSDNTAIGSLAMFATTTGNNNCAVGSSALRVNRADNNTALGALAGNNNMDGIDNSFIGSGAGFSNVFGNQNTFMGKDAGRNTFNTNDNTFIGANSGAASTGADNTFLGSNSGLVNTSGSLNTFLGKDAGRSTTNNSNNTFVGGHAGQNNTSANNTFVGADAGKANTIGGNNTYLGYNAGASGTTGNSNCFVGFSAGFSASSATVNAFFGANAGLSTTTGSSNTFIGQDAGKFNNTGAGNTAVGRAAGDGQLALNNCTFLGFNCDASTSGLSNATAIGNAAQVNANNKVRIGNTLVTVIEGQVGFTTSDGRFKNDVKNDAPGLDFILQLEPVTYHFDYPAFSDFLGEENMDRKALMERAERREMGFIAQKVEQACQAQGVDVSNLVHVPESAADNYSLAYGQLVVPLVKAVQEQQAEIEMLKSMVLQLLAAQQTGDSGLYGKDNIEVAPNPTSGLLTITLNASPAGTRLSLLSVQGKVLMQQAAHIGPQTLDLQHLPAGQYFLQCTAPGQQPQVKPIVKTN